MYYKCKDTGKVYNHTELIAQFELVPEECIKAYKTTFDIVVPMNGTWVPANSHIEIVYERRRPKDDNAKAAQE